MPIHGTLAAMSVPELLSWISQYSKTGTLEIRTPQAIETMAFQDGALIFSSSSNPESTLGRILMRSGVVTPEMHKRARELRKTKSIAVAKAFLELEMLNEDTLLRFLRKKAEKELFDIFGASEGDFTFTELDLPELDLLPLRVDITRMLMRVAQDQDEKGEYDFDATGINLRIPSDF